MINRKLVFATNNLNKLKEVERILGNNVTLLSMSDIKCFDDIPENQDTLEGNASEKAWYLYKKYKIDCFADDTGLEVTALNNQPGVLSARYAGIEKNSLKNMEKLLSELKNKTDKSARFRTVISLIIDNREYLFEGIINGRITDEQKGEKGFGYDPIFIPNGYDKTFAEMDMTAKNLISHRALAIQKLADFLSKKTTFPD